MHRLRRDREQGLVDVKDLGSIVRYCIATNPKVFAAPTTKRIARMLLDVLAELEKP